MILKIVQTCVGRCLYCIYSLQNRWQRHACEHQAVFSHDVILQCHNPTWGGVFVYGQRAGVDSTTPTFISSQTIQWLPKYIYIISRTFPITSRNPHDPIYKTPPVAVFQTCVFVAENWNIRGREKVKNRLQLKIVGKVFISALRFFAWY